jgi:hypothetical protein
MILISSFNSVLSEIRHPYATCELRILHFLPMMAREQIILLFMFELLRDYSSSIVIPSIITAPTILTRFPIFTSRPIADLLIEVLFPIVIFSPITQSAEMSLSRTYFFRLVIEGSWLGIM